MIVRVNTENVLDHFAEHGWAVLPDVLDASETAHARAELVRAAGQSEARGVPTRMGYLDPGAQNVRIYDLPRYSPVFVELARHPSVLPVVEAILHDEHAPPGDVVLSNFSANIALPGSQSMNAHNDQSTVIPGPWDRCLTMNAIWCLDDCLEETGATRYLPGSHRWRDVDEAPADPKADMVPFEAPAGSVFLMDGRLWHTSGANTTAHRERALCFAFYARSFIRLQNNWWRSLPREQQHDLDDQMRHLLGLDGGNMAYGTYLADLS